MPDTVEQERVSREAIAQDTREREQDEKRRQEQVDLTDAEEIVRLKRAVYVLHCFKKKSTRGARTPEPDMDLIRARLKAAEQMVKET